MDVPLHQGMPIEINQEIPYEAPCPTPTATTYQMPEQIYYLTPEQMSFPEDFQQNYYPQPGQTYQETPTIQKNIEEIKPNSPNQAFQTQMSPFSDERWDLDAEESKRRKEIHRQYVFRYSQPVQKPPAEQTAIKQEESQPVHSPPGNQKEEPPVSEQPVIEYQNKKDFFKRETVIPKPKTLADLTFETPKPPNLFPILKFPEKKYSTRYNVLQEILPIEKSGVNHYGTQVPFWRFD